MRKSELKFIKDTADMSRLFYEPSMHKTAQDGLSGIMNSISAHVKSQYNPEDKVSSILSLLGPGILWVLGFRWISALFELSKALGFDWTKFFSSVREGLTPFVTQLAGGHQGDTAAIESVVTKSVGEAFSNNLDPAQLLEVVDKHSSINNLLFIKKFALFSQHRHRVDKSLMHEIEEVMSRGMGVRWRKGVAGVIIRVMSWLFTAVFISAGFAVAGGLASHVVNMVKGKGDDKGNISPTSNTNVNVENEKSVVSPPSASNISLILNPKADPNLFTTTYNDNSHVWLLNLNINNIRNQLIDWAQQLYPQLNDESAFDASSKFNQTLKMFRDRNKNADQLEIIAVPQPFRSIRDIVDSFSHNVAEHSTNK